MIEIYTDGSYSRKKNKGAYAVACFLEGESTPVLVRTGVDRFSSSNKCEMLGLVNALKIILEAKIEREFIIHCDSQYCVKMFNSWINRWKGRGWKKSNKRPVLNLDLVKMIDNLKTKIKESGGYCVKVVWVKGHNGDERNELVDKLAKDLVYGTPRLSEGSKKPS